MVAYTLFYSMQSALPLPSGPRVPPAPLRSGVSQLAESVSLKPSIVQQQSAEWKPKAPAETRPSTSTTSAPRSPLHAGAAQQPLRPMRPAWEAAPLSPTRQLLSEPNMTLHEVLKNSARLDGAQQVSSQALLATVSQCLKSNWQPYQFSSHLAAALTRAAVTAAAVEQGQQLQQAPEAGSAWQQQQQQQQFQQQNQQGQAASAWPGDQQLQPQAQSVVAQQERHVEHVNAQPVGSTSNDVQQQRRQRRQQQPVTMPEKASRAIFEHSAPGLQQQQQSWPSQLQSLQWQQQQHAHVQQIPGQQQKYGHAASHTNATGLIQQDQWMPVQACQQQQQGPELLVTQCGSSADGASRTPLGLHGTAVQH